MIGNILRRIEMMAMFVFTVFALAVSARAATTPQLAPVRISGERRINFDANWRFYKGDAEGAEKPGFDDSDWRLLRLPHDWAIEGPFDEKLNPSTGALPISGTGWYRKSFILPAEARGRIFTIVFDGAMSNSTVWINGKELGGRPYGYSSFFFDLTPHLHFGSEANVVAVRLAPEPDSSRWYPGAGIYRNVRMDVTAPVHVVEWGTYVTTPQVSDDNATVSVKTEVRNQSRNEVKVEVRQTVLDASGKPVSKGSAGRLAISAGATRTIPASLKVTNPQRWDMDNPYLYKIGRAHV